MSPFNYHDSIPLTGDLCGGAIRREGPTAPLKMAYIEFSVGKKTFFIPGEWLALS
jgi:hypothetical protein